MLRARDLINRGDGLPHRVHPTKAEAKGQARGEGPEQMRFINRIAASGVSVKPIQNTQSYPIKRTNFQQQCGFKTL
jgi:hypothetical protein